MILKSSIKIIMEQSVPSCIAHISGSFLCEFWLSFGRGVPLLQKQIKNLKQLTE
jgi:hypothetical protein